MAFGSSILPPGVWCTIAVEIVLLFFHLSVALLVGIKLLTKHPAFSGAFFALYFLLSVGDLGNYFSMFFMQRMQRFGVFGDWRPHPSVCNYSLYAIGFFSYLQFACHLAIAFNRYTAIQRPTTHDKARNCYMQLWTGPRLLACMLVMLLVCAVAASVRLMLYSQPVDSEYGFQCDVQDEATIDLTDINGYIGVGFVLITCLVSFCFELATFQAFRQMNEKGRREHREDYRLLIYAMILLFTNLLMAVQYICKYLVKPSPELSNILQPYIVDLLCFSGPICLFLTSKTLRSNYLAFYQLRRKNHIGDTSLSFVRYSWKSNAP